MTNAVELGIEPAVLIFTLLIQHLVVIACKISPLQVLSIRSNGPTKTHWE